MVYDHPQIKVYEHPQIINLTEDIPNHSFVNLLHSSQFAMILEVLELLLRVWDDCIGPWLPASRANLAMFVRVHKGLDKAKSLIHTTSDWQVIHGDLSENTLWVNYEEAPERMSIILEEHTVVLTDRVCEVGEEGDGQLAQPTLDTRGGHPCQVSKMTVHGTGYNLSSNGSELFHTIVECEDFSGTNEGEIQWVKEED